MDSVLTIKQTRILLVQQINRAYRVPLLKKLAEHPGIELVMIYGTSAPTQAGDIGISISTEKLPFRAEGYPIAGFRWHGREILWFGKALEILKREPFDVIITDHYTRMLSIWPMQSIQHKRGHKFILWGIGFHQHPTPLLDKLRKKMVDRTDALLLYSEKEKQKYINMGITPGKCFVTQNTVDIEGIDSGKTAVTEAEIARCRRMTGGGTGPFLLHVGRLAPNKRLDLLLEAIPKLKSAWPGISLTLIGEGPELPALKQLAGRLSISDRVHFPGAITEHAKLAPWMALCDLVVAPGQIGLLAPMSLIYGRTLVISDKKELHGPEVQAFIPGKTGLTYRYQDVDDLYLKIHTLLQAPEKRNNYAAIGDAHVRQTMGPEQMFDAFLSAINYVINH